MDVSVIITVIITVIIFLFMLVMLYKYYFYNTNNNAENAIEGFNDEDCSEADIYLEFNGKKYCNISHVVEIPFNDSKYSTNQKRSIKRNVFKINDRAGFEYETDCKAKWRWSVSSIGKVADICDSNNRILLHFTRSNCGLTRGYKGYCINDTDKNLLTITRGHGKNVTIKDIYVNREWINSREYEGYKSLTPSNANAGISYIHCQRREYTAISATRYYIPLNPDISNSSTTYNISERNGMETAITNILTINKGNFFNVHKRNILACLWHDGEVIFENNSSSSSGIRFRDGRVGDYNKSPYIIIRFAIKEQAKQFVANILNKIQKEHANIIYNLTEEEEIVDEEVVDEEVVDEEVVDEEIVDEEIVDEEEATTTTTEPPTTTTTIPPTTTNPDLIQFSVIPEVKKLPEPEETFEDIVSDTKKYVTDTCNMQMNNDNTTNESLSLIADGHFLE
jgi:hypothetical protein